MNQLIHARFALDPGNWVDRVVDATASLKTTDSDPLSELGRMTTQEMREEIQRVSSGVLRLNSAHQQKLNRNRASAAATYGAFEIGAMLVDVFRLPFDLDLAFNVPHLVSRWDAIQSATGCDSLPKHIREANVEQLAADSSLIVEVIQHAIRAAAKSALPVTSIGYQVILREMHRCMNGRQIPTGGLAFDADHASAVNRHEVFVTHDEALASSLKAVVNSLSDWTGQQWRASIVTTPKQLEAVLT